MLAATTPQNVTAPGETGISTEGLTNTEEHRLPDGYLAGYRAPSRPLRLTRRRRPARQRPPHHRLHGDRQPPRPARAALAARDRARRAHPVAAHGRQDRHQAPRGPLPGERGPNCRCATGVGGGRIPAPGPRTPAGRPGGHPYDVVQPAARDPRAAGTRRPGGTPGPRTAPRGGHPPHGPPPPRAPTHPVRTGDQRTGPRSRDLARPRRTPLHGPARPDERPPPIIRHPAGFVHNRLTALLPPPLPNAPTSAIPLQDCDRCDRVFRAPEPGHCRDCREAEPYRAA